MKVFNQNLVKVRLQIVISILVGILVGILVAAVLNRILDFFFACVFTGSATGALATYLVLSMRTGKSEIFRVNYPTHSILRFVSTMLTSFMLFSFLSLLPLNIDRSFSVWTLNEMSKNETQLNRVSIEKMAEEFFAQGSGEISRRIDEQIQLGNLSEKLGKIELTPRGRFQVQVHRIIATIFALNKKYTSI